MLPLDLFPFFRTNAGDWKDGDRVTLRDWLLSVVPSTPFHLYNYGCMILLWVWEGMRWLSHSPLPPHWGGNRGTFFFTVRLALYALDGMVICGRLLRTYWFVPLRNGTIASRWVFLAAASALVGLRMRPLDLSLLVLLDFMNLSFFLVGTGRYTQALPWRVSRRMRPKGFPPRHPGRKRLLLIDPADEKDDRHWTSPRRQMYPPVMPYLAALVPGDWDVMLLDMVFDEIDFDMDVDVVGLTTWACRQEAFLDVARRFRSRGVCVLFGGPEVSRCPDLYQEACDSLLVGNAEKFLPRMLEDWAAGRLKKRYVNEEKYDLRNRPHPRYDLLPRRRYDGGYSILVSTSCPRYCSFCQYMTTHSKRLRPVEEVVEEIKASGMQVFWLEAPDLLIYKEYVKELSRALEPLGIYWSTHASMQACSDESVLAAASRAGLRMVVIGLESFSQASLDFVNKSFNEVDQYQKGFDLLDRYGVSSLCHLILGLPHDTAQTRDATLEGLILGRTSFIQPHLLRIFPGDGFEQRVLDTGAIRVSPDMNVYTKVQRELFPVYRGKAFTDQQLADWHRELLEDYYSFGSMVLRFGLRSVRHLPNLHADLMRNVVQSLTRTTLMGERWDILEPSHHPVKPRRPAFSWRLLGYRVRRVIGQSVALAFVLLVGFPFVFPFVMRSIPLAGDGTLLLLGGLSALLLLLRLPFAVLYRIFLPPRAAARGWTLRSQGDRLRAWTGGARPSPSRSWPWPLSPGRPGPRSSTTAIPRR